MFSLRCKVFFYNNSWFTTISNVNMHAWECELRAMNWFIDYTQTYLTYGVSLFITTAEQIS